MLNQIGEINLVQPILTWSAPCLENIIKRDISSFSSTWKILMHVYVPIVNTRLKIDVILANKEDMLWIFYRENESFQMLINTLNTQQLLNVIKIFYCGFHIHIVYYR